MVRLGICDDDREDLALIRHALDSYAARHVEERFLIREYHNALECADDLDRRHDIDALLLDICMPGLSGTQIAHEIRNRKDQVEFMFLTTSADYAVEAFALKAAHYLLKPFTQDEFDDAFSTLLARLGTRTSTQMVVKSRGGQVFSLHIDDIVYVEGDKHSQQVHLKGGNVVEARETLLGLYEELDGMDEGRFIIPYKGYIVNLSQVCTIESQAMVLTGGSRIPIVRNSYKMVKDRFFEYTFRRRGGGDRPAS